MTFSSEKYCRAPVPNAKGLIRLLCFEPKQSVASHAHPKTDEFFHVLEGRGKITIGQDEADADPGCVFHVPAGIAHRWSNGDQRLVLFSVLIPVSSYDLATEATAQKFV